MESSEGAENYDDQMEEHQEGKGDFCIHIKWSKRDYIDIGLYYSFNTLKI